LAADLNDLFKDLQSSQVKAVGNYQLGQVIGQGTYGKVKLATHALTGQQVAVKIVNKTHAAIITREIYHWRCLTHPNIAHLHEVLTTESKIYLVTEYCQNGEMLEALIRDGRCRPALAKRWFRQICLAIQYCHSRKIVHRDLKLENILLDSQNNVKLIDFGFTRECESKKLLESYCGSAAYTAPEIIVGKKYSGPEADIWSLGVILYTLLAGYLPFDDDNEAVVQDKIVQLDYEMPNAQELIQGILKEDPKERYSIEQILNHSWWTPRSDDDQEEAEAETQDAVDQDFYGTGSHHARQGSLTKREIHPVSSSQRPGDIFNGSGSPQLISPVAQHPYGAWGSQSPYTFNPTGGEMLRAAFPGGPNIPSPISSPLPSPSPMVNKSFPRYESGNENSLPGRTGSAGSFPTNPFEQRLLHALGRIGFDQEAFSKGIPAQSCDPAYGLWCLLLDQVRKQALDNGTTLEWEQSVALMDTNLFAGAGNPASMMGMMENGKRSPRPMSDPSPSSSQTNLLLPQIAMHPQQQQQSLQPPLQKESQPSAELQQQMVELKLQLDQYKLEAELLKMEKLQQEKEKDKVRLVETTAIETNVHPFEINKELPPISTGSASSHTTSAADTSDTTAVSRGERPVQDSGVSVSTSSTPHSSWELAERESTISPTTERPRRKSKGILHSLKDRFFNSAMTEMETGHSNAPSPYPPSPIPPKHFAGSTASASSSTSSATTYVTPLTPKPLPAPPAHPYPQFLQQQAAQSPLSVISYKSASTSSLALETGLASTTMERAAASSENLVGVDHVSGDPFQAESSVHSKNKGFMTWITESASGTVLNKSPVVQSPAKLPKRVNPRSPATADTTSPPSSANSANGSKHAASGASLSLEEARPQIPAIPASFFQPIWKAPSGHQSSTSIPSNSSRPSSPSPTGGGGSLATSAPSSSSTKSFRQRLASFSSSSAKITPEERQRAVAAAAAAAALVAQPAVPERAHSPSPPASPRGSGGSSSLASRNEQMQRQSEISDIIAAAVAATTSGHLKSSGSRKKNAVTGQEKPSSKKSSSRSEKSSSKNVGNISTDSASTTTSTQRSDSRSGRYEATTAFGRHETTTSQYRQPSAPSLQIPSPSVSNASTKEISGTKDALARKPSIKSSKASMPSLMTAFSAFKPSKSAPNSPLVQSPPPLPLAQQQHSSVDTTSKRNSQSKIPMISTSSGNKGSSRYEEPGNLTRVTSNSSPRSSSSAATTTTTTTHSIARTPSSRSKTMDVSAEVPGTPGTPGAMDEATSNYAGAFGDGVVVQEEVVRTKKRTTSRTSITAASIGRRSSDSVASSLERSDSMGPYVPTSLPSTPENGAAGAAIPNGGGSKRASLGSLSSRRSSSSSMRDRNILGLTLDGSNGAGGSGSAKSSLNLSRTSLNKAMFVSPTQGSPVQPRRGGEMDRERLGYGSAIARASQDDVHATSSPRVSMSYSTEERAAAIRREHGGQHSRSGSWHETGKESIGSSGTSGRKARSPVHAASATFHPRAELASDVVSTAAGTSSTISPSISASSSMTRVPTLERIDVFGEQQTTTTAATAADSAQAQASKDEELLLNSDAPRLDFADGCSLIPSPPPSPAPLRPDSVRNSSGQAISTLPLATATLMSAAPVPIASTMRPIERSLVGMLEEPKINLLSTSYPPPRTSFSYNRSADAANDDDDDDNDDEETVTALQAFQAATSPPSPSRPLVSFDQHFSNNAKIKDFRDSTTPRKVVNGFQPLAAKRLSKPGLPHASSAAGAFSGDAPALPGQESSSSGLVPTYPSNTTSSSFSSASGPPNSFAGRRRGYRNSTGSMANMTLHQQQNFQQLQREQLMKIQQNQHQPNAGYEATAAMKLNPRPRTGSSGFFPKREYGGVSLGGLGGLGGNTMLSSPSSSLATCSPLGSSMGAAATAAQSAGQGQGLAPGGAMDHALDVGGAKRDSYSSRRKSMAVGKRSGAAPAAIQEEEE
ncbi:hypothetical protein BGZ99_003437, partial [Dissophora globulifera]